MRKYYVEYGEFPNVYNLCYSASQLIWNRWIRISKRHALRLAKTELLRRQNDSQNAGFADAEIYPAEYDRANGDISRDSDYELRGLIWERKVKN